MIGCVFFFILEPFIRLLLRRLGRLGRKGCFPVWQAQNVCILTRVSGIPFDVCFCMCLFARSCSLAEWTWGPCLASGAGRGIGSRWNTSIQWCVRRRGAKRALRRKRIPRSKDKERGQLVVRAARDGCMMMRRIGAGDCPNDEMKSFSLSYN